MLVGGGPAADGAAFGLRQAGFDGSITLVSEEPRAPYERPPLSKGFLTGGGGPSFLRPLERYAEAGIELRLGVQVVELDTDHRLVRLAGGDSLEYDLALLATGVAARCGNDPGPSTTGRSRSGGSGC